MNSQTPGFNKLPAWVRKACERVQAKKTPFEGHRATMKKLKALMTPEQKMVDFMLGKLSRSILRGQKTEANIIAKAIKILFPKTADVLVADAKFGALWKMGRHNEAIAAYFKGGRLFWYSEQIAKYYERRGLMSKAVEEYEYLVNT